MGEEEKDGIQWNVTNETVQETTPDDDVKNKVNEAKSEKESDEKAVQNNVSIPGTAEEDKYVSTILHGYTVPDKAEGMLTKDNFKKTYGEEFLKKFDGNKTEANAAMDQYYELISHKYQNQAGEESNFKMLESLSHLAFGMENVDFVGEDFEDDKYITQATTSGRRQMLTEWTDPTRSMRQAQLNSKQYVNYNGDVMEYEGDIYNHASNAEYADDKGNNIIAFEYQPYSEYQRDRNMAVKAVYEGQTPEGEVISKLDSGDWFLSSNGIDTSTWKVGVGSVYDFVIDVVDTAMSIVQYGALGVSLGTVADTEFYSNIKDTRTKLGAWTQSKSDADQESMITLNNALNLGINITGQLLTGRAIAGGMSKIVGVGKKTSQGILKTKKALDKAKDALGAATTSSARSTAMRNVNKYQKLLTKQSKTYNRKSNLVKGVTLASMGAMQAKATADEAERLGFAPAEVAAIYFASLGSMMAANKLSDLGFDRLGLNAFNPIIKRAVKTEVAGVTPATGGVSAMFQRTKAITMKARYGLEKAVSGSSVAAKGLQEGLQEETEYIFDEMVKHGSTMLAWAGYDAEAPAFKTMMDEGYWNDFFKESAMNIVAGAAGGAGASVVTGSYKHKTSEEDKLPREWLNNKGSKEGPQKGRTAEVFKKIAYYSTRTEKGVGWEKQLYKTFDKQRKRGAWGREDISTKWDSKNGRYKRTNELTKTDIAQGHTSQADMQYKAIINQYEYYKHIYRTSSEAFNDIKSQDPEFGFAMNSPTVYEETRDLLDEKAKLYAESTSEGNIDFDNKLRDIIREKDKVRSTEEGEIDRTRYDQKVSELSKVTKLSKEDVERLAEVNSQLEDISTGKALENTFIKYQLNSPKYKDKLDYNTLKSLLTADMKAQSKHELDKEIHAEQQKDNDAMVKQTVVDGVITEEGIQGILELQPGAFLSVDSKKNVEEGIANLGNNLEAQKAQFQTKILSNVESVITDIISTQPDSLQNSIQEPLGKKGIQNYVKKLKAAQQKGSESLIDFFNTYEDISLLPTDNNRKLAYLLNKMNSIAAVHEPTGFVPLQFDISKPFSSSITGGLDYVMGLSNAMQGMKGLNMMALQEPESSPKIGKLITESDDFLDVLDDQRSTKKKLQDIVDNSKTFEPKEVRNDLFYGFTKNAAQQIKGSDVPLDTEFLNLIESAAKDEEGNVLFFNDTKAALDLSDQIDTRLAEVEFIMEFFPTLAKINDINENQLKNDNPENTFLTKYMENYVDSFENFQKDPTVAYTKLKIIQIQLDNLKKAASSLLNLSVEDEIKVDYSGIALDKAKKELDMLSRTLAILDQDDDVRTLYYTDTEEGIDNKDEDGLYEGMSLFTKIKTLINHSNEINGTSKEDIAGLYDIIYKTKKLLNNEYKNSIQGNESIFLTRVTPVIRNSTTTVPRDIFTNVFLRYTLSPTDEIHAIVKSSINDMFKEKIAIEDMLIPTMEQMTWIEEMVTGATNKDFLKYNAATNNEDNYVSGMFFTGLQGTGKSQVVMKHVADILHKLNWDYKTENGGVVRELAFVSPEETMRKSILNGKSPNVPESNKIKTQKDLYDILVKHGDDLKAVAAELNDVGSILFDEISLVEYSRDQVEKSRTDVKNAYTLNAILAQLDIINTTYRQGMPLVLIGIGDETQPGFIQNSKSPRKPDAVQSETDVNPKHIFNSDYGKNTYISRNTILSNFRSKVRDMADDITAMQSNLTEGNKETELKYSTKEGNHLGIRVQNKNGTVRTFKEIANDTELINDIRKKITEDNSFSVAVVIEENQTVEELAPDSLLKQLMDEKPDNFRPFTIEGIQGSEADYVLANIPEDFAMFKFKGKNDLKFEQKQVYRHKVSLFKTLLGRAHYFTDIGNYKIGGIKNIEQTLYLDNKKFDSAVKQDWIEKLNDGVLYVNEDGINSQIIIPSNESPKDTTEVVPIEEAPKETIKSENSGTVLQTDTTEIIKPYDPKLRVVNTDGVETQLREHLSTLLTKYGSIFKNPGEYDSLSIEDLNNLTKEIEAIVKQAKNGTDVSLFEDAQKLLSELQNFKSVVTGQDNSSFINELGVESEAKTTVNKDDVDFMREVQLEEGKIVAYQDFTSRTGERDELATKMRYLRQMYGPNIADEADSAVYRTRAFKYKKDGDNTNLEISDDFTYYIVSYRGKGENEKGNVIVGHPKGNKNKMFMIGQLPPIEFFATEHSKNADKNKPTVRALLEERRNLLEKNLEQKLGTRDANILSRSYGDNEFVYIESKIDPSVISGLTVGNLNTTDANALKIIQSQKLLDNSSELINTTEPYVEKTYVTQITKGIKKGNKWIIDEKNFDDTTFPFKAFPVAGETKALLMPYKNTKYIVVKTSKGNIPFVHEKNKVWTPVIGIDLNDNLVTDDRLLNEGTFFDKELHDISKAIHRLPLTKHVGPKESNKEVATRLSTYSDVDSTIKDKLAGATDNTVKLLLMQNFKNKKNRFLSEVKLSLDKAKEIREKTSGAVSTSEPKVIMEGEHAGKGVMFYTFRKDVNLQTMTSNELLTLYNQVIDHKNQPENATKFSDNRLGIGVMLLDVKGQTLSEIIKNNPKVKLEGTSPAHMNKVMLSGAGETSFIGLLATLHNKIMGDVNQSEIAEQLAHEYKHDDKVDKWLRENKNSEVYNLLGGLLGHVFSADSLGSLVATYNIGPESEEVMHQIKILKNIFARDGETKVNNKIKELFEGNKKLMEDINKVGIENMQQLRSIVMQEGSATGATGRLALDKDGKVILEKTHNSVITAVNTRLVKNLMGEGTGIIPEPKFNMYALIGLLHKVADTANLDFTESLASLDNLLVETGFPDGIFVSPYVQPTANALGDIESSPENVSYIFETDVKRIKQPQVVLNSKKLITTLTSTNKQTGLPAVDTVNTALTTVDVDTVADSAIEVTKKLQNDPDRAEFENMIEDITDMTVDSESKRELYEQVNAKFYSTLPLPTETSIDKIDFTKHFLKTPETENFINSLNSLRDLSINQDIKEFVWHELLNIPAEFTPSQQRRLLDMVGANTVKNSMTSIEQAKSIKNLFKNKTLKNVSFTIKNPESTDKFANIYNLMDNITYPVHNDISPENRALMLIATLTHPIDDNAVTILTDEKVSVYLTSNPTSNGYAKNWVRKALEMVPGNTIDFASLSTKQKAELEALPPLSEQEIGQIMATDNLMSKEAIDLAKTMYQLANVNSDPEAYRNFLLKLKKDMDSIYYNKDVKHLATDLVNTALDHVQLLEGDLDHAKRSIEAELETYTDEHETMVENATRVKNVLSNIDVTKLNDNAQSELNNVLEAFSDEYAAQLADYIDGNLEMKEGRAVALELAKLIATTNLSSTDKMDISKRIAAIAADEKYICR